MIARTVLAGTLFLLCFSAALAQDEGTTLTVQVVLIDKELNLKPVPKFTLTVRAIEGVQAGRSISLKTGFDGTAAAQLRPGRYHLSTPDPVEFQGNRYRWELGFTLPAGGAKLELSNDNATVTEMPSSSSAEKVLDPVQMFERYQNSVATVWSEFGHGTGFFVDGRGLLLTNQHVIGPSAYISVQFDSFRKVEATLLEANPEKDIAVLWIHPQAFPEAVIAPLAGAQPGEPPVVVGEKVYTIGSPLSQRKIMTTGIVSSIEERAIMADISINPGNSGGPLFDSQGQVVGITTFREQARIGPGIAGIVRIEEALPLLQRARDKSVIREPPSLVPLLVEPPDAYPLEGIKRAIEQKDFDSRPYFFSEGKFDVAILTPPLVYYLADEAKRAAAKEMGKRTKKSESVAQLSMLSELYGWREYLGHLQPVITIRARPQLRETFWSGFSRALAQGAGPAKLRFRTDFHRMRLLCGSDEVQPIHPGKIAHVISENNQFVNAIDATYEGIYTYPPDAISPDCGTVRLELYSEKEPDKARAEELPTKTILRIAKDFEPYGKAWKQRRKAAGPQP